MSKPSAQELITELDLGSARGGRKASLPVTVEVVRALTDEDLAAIKNPPPVAAGIPAIHKLRHSHHRLAELLVKGLPQGEISLLTGYSQSYISILQGDPAFQELVSYYQAQKQTIFVDAMERLRVVGIDATEKLHEMLNDPSRTWSPREIMELVEMAVVKPAVAAGQKVQGQSSGPAAANVSLEIKFVGAQPGNSGPVLEANFTDVTPQAAE